MAERLMGGGRTGTESGASLLLPYCSAFVGVVTHSSTRVKGLGKVGKRAVPQVSRIEDSGLKVTTDE